VITSTTFSPEHSRSVSGATQVSNYDKLENARNDAVHSPLFQVDRSLYGSVSIPEKIAPAWWLFNQRARNLSKRTNLLSEFRYCRDAAIVLADYAQLIDAALANKGNAWPKKPTMPHRRGDQPSAAQSLRRQSGA
jgi:hypothetical protein